MVVGGISGEVNTCSFRSLAAPPGGSALTATEVQTIIRTRSTGEHHARSNPATSRQQRARNSGCKLIPRVSCWESSPTGCTYIRFDVAVQKANGGVFSGPNAATRLAAAGFGSYVIAHLPMGFTSMGRLHLLIMQTDFCTAVFP